ncbi:hypothetical protein ACWGAN_26970 [Streptomyces sp. NPDC054945]
MEQTDDGEREGDQQQRNAVGHISFSGAAFAFEVGVAALAAGFTGPVEDPGSALPAVAVAVGAVAAGEGDQQQVGDPEPDPSRHDQQAPQDCLRVARSRKSRPDTCTSDPWREASLRLPAVRNQQCPPPVTQRWEINKTPRKWQFFDKTALYRFRPQGLSVR